MGSQIKKYRKNFDYSYTLGVFPTLELLKHKGESVSKILISSKGEGNSGISEIIEICEDKSIRFEINDKLINRLSLKENCYAIGIFEKFQTALRNGANHLVLVNPGNMGNLGTIARTMLGFCVNDLGIISPAADMFDPRAIRSSMGATFQISFQYFNSIHDYMQAFGNNLYTFMINGKTPLDKTDFREPFSAIFGSESSGLPDEYLDFGTSVSISHSENIDSLNLSVAVGIALYAITNDTAYL